MNNKFIINDNTLVMSVSVKYHSELLFGNRKRELTTGGGQATEEQFRMAMDNSHLERTFCDAKIVFSRKEYYSEVLMEESRLTWKGINIFLTYILI